MISKHELNKLLNKIPYGDETIIEITRAMGDKITFYHYERYKIRLFDEHLLFYETEDKPRIIRYDNIIQVSYRPLFKEKHITDVIEAEYKTKKTIGEEDRQ